MAKKEPLPKSPIDPLNDRIVLKPSDAPNETPGGILLPDVAKQESRFGLVLAVGPGAWNRDGTKRIPMTVHAGEEVAYGRYAGNKFEIGGEEYLVMTESEVLGIKH